ncbi:MAG: hybrid sensor histidine kinase/response regulator [Pseudomonadota bacterium]
MLSQPFDKVIRELCEDILSEPVPERLPARILQHVEQTFPVAWATLWLTEQKAGTERVKGESLRLRLAAASGPTRPLYTAENGSPAVYDFGEGLTGTIAKSQTTINITCPEDLERFPHKAKYDAVIYQRDLAGKACGCVLGVPLVLRSTDAVGCSTWAGERRTIGVLRLVNIQPSEAHPEPYFTAQDVAVVEAYAAVIAVAMEKARLRADSMRIGQGLLNISGQLLVNLGECPDFGAIVEETARVISAESCTLWLRQGRQLRLAAAWGYSRNCQPWEVPPYHLDVKKSCEDELVEQTYAGKGLTVYVANTLETLNLENAAAVKGHFAWKGDNDQRMWGKKPGEACYSLVAIPLVDRETNDLKGVFKIENKRPTIYQMQSHFTKEDEDLLTTLGNSFSLSLIISERMERLRRLEKLVGQVRVLDGLEDALFFILTGLTHNDGLQYNRALVFVRDEVRRSELKCRFALGAIDPEAWVADISSERTQQPLHIDHLLGEFGRNRASYVDTAAMRRWAGQTLRTTETSTQVIARHLAGAVHKTEKYHSSKLGREDILYDFARGDFVLIPIFVGHEVQGVIYADNCYTGNRVTRFECEVLDIFAGMAGSIIQASREPERLRRERDEAWNAFAGPAAHRLGTETSIINDTLDLRIQDMLDQALQCPRGIGALDLEALQKSMGTIRRSVTRLRFAAKDYANLTSEQESPGRFDLVHIVRERVEYIQKHFDEISVEFRHSEAKIELKTRRRELDYVLEELLTNAWKCTSETFAIAGTAPRDHIRVLVSLSTHGADVECLVCDDGPGISTANVQLRERLFKSPVKGRKGGTGLGLSIVRRKLEENGGTIELFERDKPEGYPGACFRITLPLEEGVGRQPVVAEAEPSLPLVMVVEDNEVHRQNLAILLRRNGVGCVQVRNETEAMERLSPHTDAIVADLDLSEAGGDKDGGIQLARLLSGSNIRLPYILLSCHPWEALPKRGTPAHSEKLAELNISAVVDRTSETYRGDLIGLLRTLLHLYP